MAGQRCLLWHSRTMTEWIEVLKAITAGPDLAVRGVIRETRTEGDDITTFFGNFQPLWVDARDGCQVWRHGAKLRIESPEGLLVFITDGARAWDFSQDPAAPLAGTPAQVRHFGDYQLLLGYRDARDWQGEDFTRPTGPVQEVEFAGRQCWTVDLAPPEHKPHPLRIWVDVESGQMLGVRSEAGGEGQEFTDVVVGEEFDDALFAWDGPVTTIEELDERDRARRREREREQAAWFAEHVSAAPLRARAWIDFTPRFVNRQASGAFDAHGDTTAIARRPRGADGWDPDWGGNPRHTWSTPEWDWAATAGQLELDDESIRDLQQRLHPGEPVDRPRRTAHGERD